MTNTEDLTTWTAEQIAGRFLEGSCTSLLVDLRGHLAVDPDGDMLGFMFGPVQVNAAYVEDPSTMAVQMVWLETSSGDFFFDAEDDIPVVI